MTSNQFKQWKDTEPMSKYAYDKVLNALARGEGSVTLSIEKMHDYDQKFLWDNFTVTKYKDVLIVHL